jgi:hypothetical protein
MDRATCAATSGCVPLLGCSTDCNGAAPFLRCQGIHDPVPPISCPIAQPCSEPIPCQALDRGGCEAAADCHPVYSTIDPCPTDCAGDFCCVQFARCETGKAQCLPKGAGACTISPVVCHPPFVLSYANSCEDGCVRAGDCQ